MHAMSTTQVHGRDTLETPERVDLDVDLADVGSRALAFVLDSLLLLVVFIATFFAMLAAGQIFRGWAVALWWISNFLLQWFYFATFEAVWSGQTPGKRALDLRVQRVGGYPIAWPEALIRNFLRPIVDMPLLLLPFGVPVMLFSRRHQRIGDLAAGTVVVRERTLGFEDLREMGYAPDAGDPASAAGPELTLEEFELLRDFLVRRDELEPESRRRIGGALARLLRERLAERGRLSDALRGPDDEGFLVRVDAAYRGEGST